MRTRRREAEGRKEGREGSGGGGRRGRGVVLWRSVWFGLVSVEFHFVFFFSLFFFFGCFGRGFAFRDPLPTVREGWGLRRLLHEILARVF